MDNIIATICRDAEQKLASHTAEIQNALKQSREELLHLHQENARLKQYIDQVESSLRKCREVPVLHDATLARPASDAENQATSDERMDVSLLTLERMRVALQNGSRCRACQTKDDDYTSPIPRSTTVDRNNIAQSKVLHEVGELPMLRTALDEDKQKIKHKYETLKEYCSTLQSKYRKERGIWKQWIAHMEGKEGGSVMPMTLENEIERNTKTHEAAIEDTVLVDRSTNELPKGSSQTEGSDRDSSEQKLIRALRNPDHDAAAVAAVSTLAADLAQYHKAVKAEPMSDSAMPPSSSQEAHSLDLDQTTIRKPIDRVRALRDFSDDENTTPTRSKVPGGTNSKRAAGPAINAVLEDEAFTNENDLQHEAKRLLNDLLSTPPAVLPGKRRMIKQEDHGHEPRSLKRTRSESSAPTQDMRNASRRRALRSTTEVDGPRSTTDYVINKAANNGLGHAFHEVVRGKEARRKLHADDCPCCSKFYEMAGPAPPGLAPVWRSPPPADGPVELERETTSTTRQQVGRHRTTWRRSPTPPSFWEADFPTTQEVAKQKELNELRRRRKIVEMQTEAKRPDGRYTKRVR